MSKKLKKIEDGIISEIFKNLSGTEGRVAVSITESFAGVPNYDIPSVKSKIVFGSPRICEAIKKSFLSTALAVDFDELTEDEASDVLESAEKLKEYFSSASKGGDLKDSFDYGFSDYENGVTNFDMRVCVDGSTVSYWEMISSGAEITQSVVSVRFGLEFSDSEIEVI